MRRLEPEWVGLRGVDYSYVAAGHEASGFVTFDAALSAARAVLLAAEGLPNEPHRGRNIIFTVPNNQRWLGWIGGSCQFFNPGEVVRHINTCLYRRLF